MKNDDVWIEELIVTNLTLRGKGEEGSPLRRIRQVWTREGELVAEYDPYPWKNKKEEA